MRRTLFSGRGAFFVSPSAASANEQPMKTMRRAGFVDLVGEEHFRPNIDDAIAHARELLEAEEAAKGVKGVKVEKAA